MSRESQRGVYVARTRRLGIEVDRSVFFMAPLKTGRIVARNSVPNQWRGKCDTRRISLHNAITTASRDEAESFSRGE